MRFHLYTFFFLVATFLLLSCEDSYNDSVDSSDAEYVTNDPKYPPSELDTWLKDNFTSPFNIEVKYRWDASDADIYRTLVPPKVAKVQPVMQVVKDIWITPYTELAGGTFIRDYCPKQFLLIGSARYNIDGTFTLGTAEGGRKVVLYVVNEFDPAERTELKSLMHIVHHEFGHILNQKVAYPPAFREVTKGAYTGDWRFFSVGYARASGFITNYAMASPDEDFVEMIATMLMEGKDGYEAILECETNAASRNILRKKEQLVVQYFKDAFNIDFYALQTRVQSAMNKTAPKEEEPSEQLPPLFDSWGFEKEKTSVRFDLTILNEPAQFVARFNQDNNIMHQAGYALDYNFKLHFIAPDMLALRLYYYELADEAKVFKQANFYYFFEVQPDGTVRLQLNSGDDNAVYLSNELKVQALMLFFRDRIFTIDWLQMCNGYIYVAFYPKDSPENYSFGMLEN